MNGFILLKTPGYLKIVLIKKKEVVRIKILELNWRLKTHLIFYQTSIRPYQTCPLCSVVSMFWLHFWNINCFKHKIKQHLDTYLLGYLLSRLQNLLSLQVVIETLPRDSTKPRYESPDVKCATTSPQE